MANYENDKLYEDEIAFNIFEILKYFMRNIKTLFVGAIIGALLVPMLLYVNDTNEYNTQMEVLNNEESVVLSDTEELGVEKYFLLKARVEYLREKVNNVKSYTRDLENLYQTNIVYNINGEETYRYDIAKTLVRYVENMQSDLVYVSFLGDKENLTEGVFVVSIYADTEDACKTKTDSVKESIAEYDASLQKTMTSHTLSIIEEENTCGYAETLYEINKKYLDEYRTVNNEFESSKLELNELQQAAIMQIEARDGEDTVELIPVKPQLQIIYVVLGAVLGLIIVCVILVCVYLLGGKIQTDKEVYRRTGYTHFGTLKVDSDEQMNHILTSIEIANQTGEKDIAILSTVDIKENVQVNSLCKQLEEKGMKAQLVINAEKDMNILSKIKNAKTVVLVESVMKTKIKSMYRLVRLCEQADANVLGYIMIDR